MKIYVSPNSIEEAAKALFKQTNLTHRGQLKLLNSPSTGRPLSENDALIENINSITHSFFVGEAHELLELPHPGQMTTRANLQIRLRDCLLHYECPKEWADFMALTESTCAIQAVKSLLYIQRSRQSGTSF